MDAEFSLSRERKRADSASCLQLRGVLAREIQTFVSAVDSRLADERKLRRSGGDVRKGPASGGRGARRTCGGARLATELPAATQ